MPLLTIADLNQPEGALAPFLACAAGLSAAYESFLDEEIKQNGKNRPSGIHASEVSGCPRKVVYSLRGERREPRAPPRWRRRFALGHAIHKMFQDDFERMARRSNFAYSFEPEVPISPEHGQVQAGMWDIHSHCDGVFTVRDGPFGPALVRVALEIKSTSADLVEKMQEPDPEHVEQAHVYMACLNGPRAWILYFNKGNQNYTPSDNRRFLVRFNPAIWGGLEKRFEAAHAHAATGTLPDRVESVVCEFCPFAWTCQPTILVNKAPAQVHKPPRRFRAK